MTAEVVGEAQVLITADFSTFDDQLKAKLTAAAQKAGSEAEKILKRSGQRGGKGFAEGVSKAADSEKTLERIRSAIVRLEAASVRAGDAQIDAAEKVRRAEAALAKTKRETSTVTLDGAEKIIAAENRVAKARRDAARADQLATRSTTALGEARQQLADAFSRQGDEAGLSFIQRLTRAVRRGADGAGSDSGGFFGRAFRTAASKSIGAGLFKTLAVGAGGLLTALSPLSTLLGGASAAVVALAGALSIASGSAFALGGVLGSLGLVAGTLAVGFSGLGDAMDAQSKAQEELARTGEISAATQEKLDAAMKGLAPSAAAVVRQLTAMAPAWQAVQRSVQERLFTDISTTLAALGNRYLPVLNQALGQTATILNGATRNFSAFLNTSTRATQISQIFSGLNGILRTLLGPLSTVAGGFLDIFQASLPFAQQLANVLSSLSTRFGEFLTQSASNGAFTAFMQTATQLAGTLFRLLGNVASIIGQVFSAGAAAGGGLLKTLADITGQFSQFLRSAEGQSALASFFGLISQAGDVLVNTFQTLRPLLSGIGSLFRSLEQPISVLGQALTGVVGQLAVTLGEGLTQLGPVLGQLVTALAPVVTILGSTLNGALKAILPVIVQLVSSFAQLLPSLTPVIQILGTFLVGVLSRVSGVVVQILPVLAQLIASFATGLAPVLSALSPVLLQIVDAFLQLVVALLPVITSLLPLLPALAQLSLAFTQVVIALAPLITTVLVSLTQLIVALAPYIAQLVPPLVSVIGQFTQFTLKIAQVLTVIVSFVSRAVAAFNGFSRSVATTVAGMITAVVNFFAQLPGRIGSIISAVEGVVRSGLSRILGFFRALPGQVVGALGNLGGALNKAGREAIQGLVNGLTSGLGKVRDIAGQIGSAISGTVGKVLDIGSPSRVAYALGEFFGEGLINGIKSKVTAVGKAAGLLASAAPDKVQSAFKKLDSTLLGLAGQLPAVARQRINAVVVAGRNGIAAITRASDGLDARLKASQTRLQDLLKSSQQLAQSVSQAILQTGNIAQGNDTSFSGIVNRLRSAVTNAQQFAKVLAGLRKAGLNAATLQQIAEAGPEVGTALGQSLLRSGVAGLNTVNRLQNQLTAAAAQAAKTASDAVFGQGIQLARGLVAGLTQQRASLDKQMTRLADVLVARVLQLLRALKLPGVNTLNIPGFKDGGVISRDGIYRGAEQNRPEVVIPLTKPRRARQLMDQTGLTSLQQTSKSRTVEVPVHIAGSVVDYDALTAFFQKLFAQYGLKPVLGLNVAGGTV